MKRHVEMRSAYQELLTWEMLPLALTIMGVLTTLFTWWDPMDMTRTMNVLQRLGFSVFIACSDLLICYSCGVLLLYLARFRSRLQSLTVLLAAAPLVAVPCSALMYAGYALYHQGRAPNNAVLQLYAVNAMNLLWTATLMFYCLVCRLGRRQSELPLKDGTVAAQPAPKGVSAGVSADRQTADGADTLHPAPTERLADRDNGAVASNDAVEDKPHQPALQIRPVEAQRLLESLPAPVGKDVVYVHVSGHYLNVVTTSGSVVVQMRLADAVAALDDRGMQVHRSYWVAARHVRRLVRRDHRMQLCLTDGHEVPVSHPFLPSVRNFIAKSENSAVQ